MQVDMDIVVNELIEGMAEELAGTANLEPNDSKYYAETKEKAEQAKKNIGAVASDVLSPGMSELLPLLANSTNVTEFATNHLERKKKLDAALNEYTEAIQMMSCFAIEHAFQQGLKAGVRLQLELKKWAEG